MSKVCGSHLHCSRTDRLLSACISLDFRRHAGQCPRHQCDGNCKLRRGSECVFHQRTSGGGVWWVYLGTFYFTAGTSGSVLVSDTGASGYVIADAFEFVMDTQKPLQFSASSGQILLTMQSILGAIINCNAPPRSPRPPGKISARPRPEREIHLPSPTPAGVPVPPSSIA